MAAGPVAPADGGGLGKLARVGIIIIIAIVAFVAREYWCERRMDKPGYSGNPANPI